MSVYCVICVVASVVGCRLLLPQNHQPSSQSKQSKKQAHEEALLSLCCLEKPHASLTVHDTFPTGLLLAAPRCFKLHAAAACRVGLSPHTPARPSKQIIGAYTKQHPFWKALLPLCSYSASSGQWQALQ